jgi:eukaryotic-like serine/threonine-protein kinase
MNACPTTSNLLYALSSANQVADLAEHAGSCPSCRELMDAMQEQITTMSRSEALHDCDEAEVLLAELEDGLRAPDQLAALLLHVRDCSLCYEQLALLEGQGERALRRLPTGADDDDLFVLRDSDRFEIKRRLGSGGMGVVYEAYDHKHKVTVALKTLRDLGPQTLYRLKNEFRARQDLQHPNLVNLGELIEQDGQWFFTMELVHGTDFLRYVRPWHEGHHQDVTDTWQTEETADVPRTAPFSRYQLVDRPALPMPVSPPSDSGAGFDEDRLRSVLGQLCLALRALHDAGKVHRDVKPANILISADGRLALLDFGLIVDVDPDQTPSDTAGTPAYMAPEQAAGEQVGPAADLYSVGVLLYQALTGQRPFPGSQIELLLSRGGRAAKRPRAVVPAVPADLDALCMDMLAFEPEDRPTVAEVLTRLHGRSGLPAWEPSTTQSGAAGSQLCVGRDRELDALKKGFAQVEAGASITMLIHGEPGVGKSTLMQHFRGWLRRFEANGNAVVLTGRCYERESVPYKAFDKVIDALSRYLGRREPHQLAAILPERASILGRVFPVLGRVVGLGTASLPGAVAAETLTPHELRGRMFTALRQLLVNIAGQVPPVILIDDLHWADADSLALIEAIAGPPDAPRLLLVATIRDASDAPARRLRAAMPGQVRQLALDRLDHDAATLLASKLLAQQELEYPPSASDLAREAGGHPLFIQELVRGASTSETTGARFENALWSRIETLARPTRRLLEIAVVAGVPMRQGTLGRAAGIDASAIGRYVDELRAANLLRAAAQPGWLEPYHERVSSTVLAHLHARDRRSCHERLAQALEAAGVENQDEKPDPETLAAHWRGAGDLVRASRFAARAAAQAARALAFDQAARLYRMALELTPSDDTAYHRLLASLGEALDDAGHGSEAADAFAQAASEVAQSSPGHALRYRLRAAECLLAARQVEPALAAFEALLEDIGLPAGRPGVLEAARRVRMELGGMSARARPAEDIAPEALLRLDIGWTASLVLNMAAPARAAECVARHLRAAQGVGEPDRIARALALEAAQRALRGKSSRRITAALNQAEDAARLGDPARTRGLITAVRGLRALSQGAWKAAHDLAGEAEREQAGSDQGLTLERGLSRVCLVRALFYLGRWGEMSRLIPRLIRETEACRGRRWYVQTHLQTGLSNAIWLAADDVYTAQSTRDQGARRWSSSSRFLVQHLDDLLARHHIDLYTGEGAAAWADMERSWPALERSGFLDYPLVRIECTTARAQSALAAAAAGQRDLVRVCARDAGQLAGEKLPHAVALAELLRAGAAVLRRDQDSAMSHLGQAARLFEAADMALHTVVSRRCLGAIMGGAKGRELGARADRWMQGQGIVAPARIAAMLAPGCALPPR